jgi:hypothetical protein
MVINFRDEFINATMLVSDINEHLETLRYFASKCNHVTEFGVRSGNSTRAFLYSDVILRSYDLYIDETVNQLFDIAKGTGKDVQYICADTKHIEIEETDFLFIDTEHTYNQLFAELVIHGNKAKKYIGFHDTFSFGLKGDDGGKGLLSAIIEYLIIYPHWRFSYHTIKNNGLTIIERC